MMRVMGNPPVHTEDTVQVFHTSTVSRQPEGG